MNILLLGSGAREHAFALKITQSPLCQRLFVAPGNAGTAQIATNVSIKSDDFESIAAFALRENITMVVVGPEDPLVKGIYDFFQSDAKLSHIAVIGPSQKGATLEGSKEFAKEFMCRHHIPTARYKSFTLANLEEGYAFLETLQAPYVLKADGLAAGKGVLILNDLQEAKAELKSMLSGKFAQASQKVVIEEFLSGIELSCFVLTDGKSYKILPTAKDYKRIGEGDVGLNTGGMGAVSPVPFATVEFMEKVEQRIIRPTINGIEKEGISYKGFVFIGLINVAGEPFVIEYNVRMGDPETEVVLPRIETDMVALFKAVSEQKLADIQLKINSKHAATVVVVAKGYPEDYEKGKSIIGIDAVSESLVFHAGTIQKEQQILSNGGRVLAVTSLAEHFKNALALSYSSIEKIHFEGMYFRRDIGFDL